MNAFRFQTVPTLVVEFGAARRLGALLRAQFPALERLCVVTDGFLHRSGLLNPALADLAAHGWNATVIDDVIADPPEPVVLEATARARNARAEIVLGLGGGSSMDVAKLIAVLAPQQQQPLGDMYGVNKVAVPRLPLVQMPTTAGTGSEVTAVSIVTVGEAKKMGVVAPQLIADLAILDAELTLGLPVAATAATGIDAMVHAIEAYTSAHLKNPVSDMLAMKALDLLSRNLLPACEDGSNRAAREAMLLGATFAGQAFANSPVAAVHALAYPIGGIYHVPHGLSNALVLPHVLRFNAESAAHLYAELADVVVPGVSGSAPRKTNALIERLEQMIAATGIPARLRDVGIAREGLERMASDAMLQTRLLVNNPRPVSEDDALAIYTAAF
ncbi:iron-containing alcohol dehydrogenase [Paraburkholderia phenoliruptrix]|uniref:Alcohol dehydrogenase n=2 Tax=Paraburkholderia phenoliruptrix TaxID=252970 RepID=K0DR31_9BURK|nr:iron-containing alcohol dehydrogenase [Paraburkholderia phenoliruptrix]AFT88576.1 alcohol dehydrogenase [Paraburkholderia phenoliruptrix BR3459a]MDR6418842.1 alcohol dehydrogenase [Paraburkholderia phenoliruptrix]CAB4047511.1 Long-chain-alcohol dehydrogenase 1 [Paraburkholderia phenoliruptrix]